MNELKIIEEIQAVRAKNNKVWMDIVRIAIKADSVQTKQLLKTIRENDLVISGLMEDLAKD